MSRFVYSLYGIALDSKLPFPHLGWGVRKNRSAGKRVFFRNRNFRFTRHSKPIPLSAGIQYEVGLNPRLVCISSPGAGKFRVDLLKKSIHWKPSSGGSLNLAQALVTGRILGLLLPSFEPTLVLHGCVLVINDGAVGFLGPRGGGKSTLATSFLRRGFPLLSDDLAVIQKRGEKWVVQPGPPEIRLWPDAVKPFVKGEVKVEALYPETKKRRILLNGKRLSWFGGRPVPLKALFLLSRRPNVPVRFEPLKGKEALLGILGARYNQIPERPKILKDQFHMAMELLKGVSVSRLVYPSGLGHLERISDTILKNCVTN